MENLEIILPEIFLSLTIMFLLLFGVFKNNSSKLIYNLTTLSLIILFALLLNLYQVSDLSIFNNSIIFPSLLTNLWAVCVAKYLFTP